MSWEYFNPLTHLTKYTSFEQLLSKEDKKEIDDLVEKIREMWTSEPMTPNARMAAAAMAQDVDRIPCTLLPPTFKTIKDVGGNFVDFYKDPVKSVKAGLVAVLKYKLEMGFAYQPIDMNVGDVFGTKWEFLPDSLPKITEWAVKEGLNEIIEKDLPDLRKSEGLKWQIETIRFLNEKLGDLNSYSLAWSIGPYYMYNSSLRGPKRGFRDIKKNPDLAVKALDKLCDYIIDLIKYQKEKTGAFTWLIVDSLVAPDFTPPAWFKKFALPYYKKMFEQLGTYGCIAGGGQGQTDFTPLLDTFAELGFITFSFGPPTDLRKMKKLSDEKGVTLNHWAITAPTMRYGTPQQIETQVKECIRIAGPRGRYILGTDVPDHDTPDENLHAVKQSVLKHGKYPLQFE